jgi:hypothetical protein
MPFKVIQAYTTKEPIENSLGTRPAKMSAAFSTIITVSLLIVFSALCHRAHSAPATADAATQELAGGLHVLLHLMVSSH